MWVIMNTAFAKRFTDETLWIEMSRTFAEGLLHKQDGDIYLNRKTG